MDDRRTNETRDGAPGPAPDAGAERADAPGHSGRTPHDGHEPGEHHDAASLDGDLRRIDAAADTPRTGRLVMDRMRLDLVAEAKRALRDAYLEPRRPAGSRLEHEAVSLARDGMHAGLFLLVHLARQGRVDVLERLLMLGRNAEIGAAPGARKELDPAEIGRAVEAVIRSHPPARRVARDANAAQRMGAPGVPGTRGTQDQETER